MLIISIISFVLDLTILNFSKYSFGNITFFFPMLTLTFIIHYIYSNKKINPYFLGSIVLLYGIIINNNIFLSILLLLFLYYYIIGMRKNIKDTFISYFFIIITSLILYDLSIYLILILFNYVNFNINYLFYKICNSLVSNLMYSLILYFSNCVLKIRKS